MSDCTLLAISENLVRIDMTRRDLIHQCGKLFKRYESIKDVVREMGLPYELVNRYICYDGVPDDLTKRVDSNEINVELAKRIKDAASSNGLYDSKRSNELLAKLKVLDNDMQKTVLKLAKSNPDILVDRLVQQAEQPQLIRKIRFQLEGPSVRAIDTMSEQDNVLPTIWMSY